MAIKRLPTGDQGYNNKSLTRENTTEYLSELQGQIGSENYRQMSKADPIVGMILRVHKNPIRSAAWNIAYPDDATDVEKKAIDIIADEIFGESGSGWDELLGKILSMMEYGFSLFERYYQPKIVAGTSYLIPVLDQRMQASIWEILPKQRIVRQMTDDKGVVDISFEDLVFFTLNKQGNDLRGESLLRNAYSAYRRKRIYMEWMGIGVQRSVVGIPSVTVPKTASTDSPEYQAVETMLKNITFHENAYMLLQEGYKFEYFESKFNADPVQKAIDGCNTEMALSVLAQFVMLGQMGNGGAFALSRDQSDFFLDGLKYIIDLVCGVINSQVIEPWREINFGDSIEKGRIKLTGRNLNKKAGIELANTLTQLKNSGFIKPTTDDEIMLRDNLEMPELSEEEIERREDLKNNPSTLPVLPGQGPEDDDDTEGSKKAVKLAEPKKKDRSERQQMIDNANKEMKDVMQANLLMMKDKLLADIERTLKAGTIEISGLKKIEVPTNKYQKTLSMKLAGIAQDFWTRAKDQSKLNAVKLADIDPKKLTDKTLKVYVENQSTSIVDKQAAGMLNRAILTASNNSLKGLSVAQTISLVNKSVDDYIGSSGVQVDGSLIVVGTANFGETQFYNEIKDELWGYRFVGIDDAVQSEICQWYNGKTFSVDSPELATATPPLHPRCRSYMEPIYKSEVQPDILDVVAPPSVMQGKTIF